MEEIKTKKLSFRETQIVATEVLNAIDIIASQLDIKYFMFYGTLIGAVRHKGVIPWDDDIDIIMLRPDFEKFCNYCEENAYLIKPYKIITYKNNKNYPYMIARVYDTRYKIVSKNEEPYEMGVFVDIYIYDGMGKTIEDAIYVANVSDKLSSMCFLSTRKRFARDNTVSFAKMLIKFPVYCVAKIMGKKFWMKQLEKHAQKQDFEKSNYVGTVTWLSGGRDEVYKKEWFAEPIRLKFEKYEFMAPQNYDEILSQHYGDYRVLPPENKRKVHHDYETYYIGEE